VAFFCVGLLVFNFNLIAYILVFLLGSHQNGTKKKLMKRKLVSGDTSIIANKATFSLGAYILLLFYSLKAIKGYD
jgi:hypothetical protein